MRLAKSSAIIRARTAGRCLSATVRRSSAGGLALMRVYVFITVRPWHSLGAKAGFGFAQHAHPSTPLRLRTGGRHEYRRYRVPDPYANAKQRALMWGGDRGGASSSGAQILLGGGTPASATRTSPPVWVSAARRFTGTKRRFVEGNLERALSEQVALRR